MLILIVILLQVEVSVSEKQLGPHSDSVVNPEVDKNLPSRSFGLLKSAVKVCRPSSSVT